MNIKNIKTDRGFTIVELLIVIVVIGILAAITLVAFNGVQNRGKTAAAQSAANSVVKKAQAFYTIRSTYPVTEPDFALEKESALEGVDIDVVSTGTMSKPDADEEDIVHYRSCSGNGAVVSYWDFTAASGGAAKTQTLGTCS